jgi:hypothetical protein
MSAVLALPEHRDDLLRVAVAAHLARYQGLSRPHTQNHLRNLLRGCTNAHHDPQAA